MKPDWNGDKILESLMYCDNLIKTILAVVQIV